MELKMDSKVQAELQCILDDELRWVLDSKEGDDYYCTYPADYRDEISSTTIKEIFQSDDPDAVFYETINDSWFWFIDNTQDDTVTNVKMAWDEDIAEWDEVEDEITTYIDEHVHWQPDYRHYLDQMVNVDILIDTGDGNYDYVLNCVYPHYNGRWDDEIDDKAALMWLTEQMGYTKEQLNKACKDWDFGGSAYLESVERELANCASHMQQLVFLVSMTLGECLQLNRRIAASQHPEFRSEPWKNASEDFITVPRTVMCGLFDKWSGAGSVLEIALEKDLRIPLKFIDGAVPDEAVSGWNIGNVYGMCASAWKTELIKEESHNV